MMYITETLIENPVENEIKVIFEPWAFSLDLEPKKTFRVVCKSEFQGELEILHQPGTLIVFAWQGTTLTIYDENKIVMEVPIAVPALPLGMTTHGFLGMVLGYKA